MNQKRIIVSTSAFACGLCLSIGQVHSNAQAPGEAAPASQAAPPTQAVASTQPAGSAYVAPTHQDSASTTAASTPMGDSNAGGVTLEFEKGFGTGTAAPKSAAIQAREFIKEKGLREGASGMSPKAKDMLLVISDTQMGCGPEDKNFDDCRLQAFARAMLIAKQELVEFVALQISSEMKLSRKQAAPADPNAKSTPDKAQAAAPAVATKSSAMQKVQKIFDFELDKQLKKRGIDTSTPTNPADAEEAAKIAKETKKATKEITETLLADEDFKSVINSAATSELSGLQAYRCFESITPKGKGDIAVIAVYSPKSAQLQQALLGKVDAPTGLPKESIEDWLDTLDDSVLLYTHGAQVRTDEDGEVVLVVFGQKTPVDGGGILKDNAKDAAGMIARGEARRFMGEMVVTSGNLTEQSRLENFEGDKSRFTPTGSSYQRDISAITGKLDMPGGIPVKKWSFQHPGCTQETQGVVMVFSQSQAIAAMKIGEAFTKAGGSAGGKGIKDSKISETAKEEAKPQAPAKPKTGSSGQGADGEHP